ncbi:MAG: hypothetical protein K2W96_22840, partial [Gemmataceae bacterium]|nr:hypothetical protein [Gemmataceae bacterium]
MRALWAILLVPAASSAGFEPDRRVKQPTGQDWEWVAGGRLPTAYDSRRQRYQFFAPATYKPAREWPLVVWLPAGDEPAGWPALEKACTEKDWFFASPFACGAGRPANVRARLALDLLDSIRKDHRIDPSRTYLVGQGAGGELACRLAFSLPELFGGVAVLDAEAALPALAHLRHRLKDRLSVALVGKDRHAEGLLRDLAVRSKRWDDRKDLPAALAWMEEGRDARLADHRVWRV